MSQDTYLQDLAAKRKKILIILLIASGSLTVCVWAIIGIFGSVMKPAEATACQTVLREIGVFLKIYSGENGAFPEDIEHITDKPVSDMKCPAHKDTEAAGFIYLGGLKKNPPPDTILMFDKSGNHTYGRNVLFSDGQVLWCTEQIFRFHIKRMTESPYRELYPETALKILEQITEQDTEQGGRAIRTFSMMIMLLSLLTAMMWITTFIVLLRFMQVAKYK